jgi:predicted 2-oxoglutarate/Fe(II)-dependent dioxygenase YbiX
MKSITDYIKRYDNILSEDVCDQICNVDERAFEEGIISDGQKNKKIRNCIQKKLEKKFELFIQEAVQQVLIKYIKDHANFYTGLSVEDTGFEHLIYRSSDKAEYKTHVDAMDLYPRVLSISFTLNKEYEGGNFVFFNDMSYEVKNKKGSAVVFPSNFCYPHAITPVTKGTRQAIVTWIR